MTKDERTENHNSHRWSGWPGAFCLDCFIDDPLEQAVADNIEDTDKWGCMKCPITKGEQYE